MHAAWRRRAALVEWDLTGDASRGFGAVVYRAAAPALIVREFGARYGTEADVAAAIEQWLATVADRYRVDRRFQDFKTLARASDDTPPRTDDGRGVNT